MLWACFPDGESSNCFNVSTHFVKRIKDRPKTWPFRSSENTERVNRPGVSFCSALSGAKRNKTVTQHGTGTFCRARLRPLVGPSPSITKHRYRIIGPAETGSPDEAGPSMPRSIRRPGPEHLLLQYPVVPLICPCHEHTLNTSCLKRQRQLARVHMDHNSNRIIQVGRFENVPPGLGIGSAKKSPARPSGKEVENTVRIDRRVISAPRAQRKIWCPPVPRKPNDLVSIVDSTRTPTPRSGQNNHGER